MDNDDPELQAIRARRMAELQRQQGQRPQNARPGASGAESAQEQRQKEDELRNTILTQILSQEAGARLNTLKAVKPDKAKMVEDILISNARMGRLQGRLTENDLKDILAQVNSQTHREMKVNMARRALDSDDDDFDDDS